VEARRVEGEFERSRTGVEVGEILQAVAGIVSACIADIEHVADPASPHC
jgi:hypothetical protein